MANKYTLSQLKEALHSKGDKGNTFALSLLSAIDRYGHLTDKQLHCAEKMADEIFNPGAINKQGEDLGGSFVKVLEKFATAKANGLKRPALTFNATEQTDNHKIRIYPASETSSNKGWLYVKGGSGFDAPYYGKISPDGMFIASREATNKIVSFLKSIASDPVKISAMHGRQTGRCCFCAKELTDPRSVRLGYGETCASNWGLFWG